MNCFLCEGRIKVTIKGGEFLVRNGSTPDNINYERVVKLDAVSEKIDEDIMLTVNIECANDPSHVIFGNTDSSIRVDLYKRIANAAMRLAQKYYGDSKAEL